MFSLPLVLPLETIPDFDGKRAVIGSG